MSVVLRIERKTRPAVIEIKAPAVKWDENRHPRDRHGLFITIGARVRLWGGTGDGTVEKNLGGGFLQVHRDVDNRTIRVHQNYMDVLDEDATADARHAPEVPVEAPSPEAEDVHESVDADAKPVYSGPVGESDSPGQEQTMKTPETTLTVWRSTLAEEAAGLDLSDSEDRSTFRQRILDRTKNVRTALVRDIASDLGATDVPTSTSGAARALAETYIAGHSDQVVTTQAPSTVMKFTRTQPGRYHAVGANHSYVVQKDGMNWRIDVVDPDLNTVETDAGHPTLALAKATAVHYENLGDDYVMADHGGKNRMTEAIGRAYEDERREGLASTPRWTDNTMAEPSDDDVASISLFDEPEDAAQSANDAGRAAAGDGDPEPEAEENEVYTPPLDWDLDATDYGTFAASIDKANRRAERAGITHRFSFTTEQYERTIEVDKATGAALPVPQVETRYKVVLNRPTVEHDGWAFVATLSWDDEAGLVTRMAGDGKTLLARPEARKCDVCKSTRDRKDTYVVQKTHADGTVEEIQVGSNCLTQFLGMKPEGLWMLGWEPDAGDGEEREGSAGGGGESRFPIQNVLALSLAVANSRGWVSRARAGDSLGRATVDHVSDILHGRTEKGGRDQQSQAWAAQENAWRAEMAASIPQWMEQASGLHDFARTMEGDSEYAFNMRAIAGAESVSDRNLGILVSSVASQMARKEREQRDAALANSQHVGAVKDKIAGWTARLAMHRAIEGDYGTSHLYTFVTPEGNVVKWFASSEQDIDVDDTVEFTGGTIKGHGEFRGVKETNITRAKVQRSKESQAAADAKQAEREAAEEAQREEERRAYEQARIAVPEGFTPWDGKTELPVGTKVRIRKEKTFADIEAEYRGEYVEARILTEPDEGNNGTNWVYVYVPAYGNADGAMAGGFEIQARRVEEITAIAPADEQNLADFRAANPDPESVVPQPPGFMPPPARIDRYSYNYSPEAEAIAKATIATMLAEGNEVRVAYQGRYVNGRITYVTPDSSAPTIRVDVPGIGEVQSSLGAGHNSLVAVRKPTR